MSTNDQILKISIMYYSFYFGLMIDFPCRYIAQLPIVGLYAGFVGIWDWKTREEIGKLFKCSRSSAGALTGDSVT